MKIHWVWSKFGELSKQELHEIHVIRQKVFVVEQKCAYQDADEFDLSSWHLVGRLPTGRLVAYARVTVPQTKYKTPSLGRILTSKEYRGQGIGKEIVGQCIAKCQSEYPHMVIQISAQTYLIRFYKAFGFKAIGQPYDDGGIEHIDMALDHRAIKTA